MKRGEGGQVRTGPGSLRSRGNRNVQLPVLSYLPHILSTPRQISQDDCRAVVRRLSHIFCSGTSHSSVFGTTQPDRVIASRQSWQLHHSTHT